MPIRIFIGATMLTLALPAAAAIAQDFDQEERPITLVGCVMREYQYRDMYGPGLSGPKGPGIGGRNEYMLVDAHELNAPVAGTTNTTTAPATPVAGGCLPAPGTFPTAYELTGKREGELESFLGRRVELSGIQKEANARPVGTSGIARPTGGFDPLGHELHLFEVEVESFREPAVAVAAAPAPPPPAPEPPPAPAPPVAAAAPPPAAEPAPAPAPVAAAPEPAPVAEVAQAELPRTASPAPLMGLIGLFSLLGAAGLRSLRNRG